MALNDLTPQLRTRLSRLERVVGWFVTVATVLLLFGLGYYVYNIAERKGWFLQKVYYYTFVRTAAGLKVGDPVRLMGRDVGELVDIQPMGPYEAYNMYIQFRVRSPFYGYLWEDSRAKIAAGDFLGNRYIEVTKGTNGAPAYMFYDFRPVTLADAANLVGKPGFVLSEEVIHPQSKEVLLKPFDPITQQALNILAQAGAKKIFIFDKKSERKNKPPTAIWDPKLGRYKPYSKVEDAKGYWIEAVEPPPLSDRLETVVNTVETALPGFLSLTNTLVRVLTNADRILAHSDDLLVGIKPVVTNLTQITAHLSGPKGSLGEWLLPTNINSKLEATLSSADATLGGARTNVDMISTNLLGSLENI